MARRLSTGRDGASRHTAESVGEKDKTDSESSQQDISLAYLSQPLSGREYEEVSMRSIVEVDVAGGSTEEDIEDFITTLGCE